MGGVRVARLRGTRRRRLTAAMVAIGCLLAALAAGALAAPQAAQAATKPVITIQPTDQTVEKGSLATFISTARGDPRPDVKWEESHDNGKTWRAIRGATAHTLTIRATAGKDGYRYRAVFRNSAGRAFSRAATLDVKQDTKKPRITRQPPSIAVFAGKRAIFTARATGDPKPTVMWQRSRDGGRSWDYLTSQTKTTLKFSAAKVQNGFRYRAVFTNVNGVAITNPATLTVLDPTSKPVVTKQPTNEKVPAGKRATFIATASGNPTPRVKWEQSTNGKSWEAIPGARSTIYRFEATMRKDGWRFRAVFENSAGKAFSRAAKLDVVPPAKKPRITTQPTNERVNVGRVATFTATASGRPTPWVQWQWSPNGRNWRDIQGADSRTLRVKGTRAKDGNRYRAVFKNKAGVAKTRAAKLDVVGNTKPVILTQPVPQTVVNGRQATFTSAADGRPTPTVQWQQSPNGRNWSNVPGARDLTLTFTATKAKNGYLYRAVFRNTAGTTKSRAAKLTVIDDTSAPVVTRQPRDAAKISGETVQFTSTAAGVPDPTVQWQMSVNGGAWADIAGATSTTYQFTATPALNGARYRAVFRNSAGTAASSAATLTVWTAPTITAQPSDQAGRIGEKATFTSTAAGNPSPTVQWQYSPDGGATWLVIAGATSTTLDIGITGGQDGYLFRAVFSNVAGQATSNPARLTVLAGS